MYIDTDKGLVYAHGCVYKRFLIDGDEDTCSKCELDCKVCPEYFFSDSGDGYYKLTEEFPEGFKTRAKEEINLIKDLNQSRTISLQEALSSAAIKPFVKSNNFQKNIELL